MSFSFKCGRERLVSRKLGFDLTEFRNIPLPSEREIMASWKGDPEQPVVSVLCNTYNHEIYIEDAIRGFLIQKTDFPFEVIIHDDASSDDTKQIIEHYADKYPNIIRPVFQEVNQYSQGKKPSILSFQFAKGDYIALCEGDDFWICKSKLELEVEAAQISGCGLVFTAALTLKNELVSGRIRRCKHLSGPVPLRDIVFGGAAYCPTASLLIKREAMEILSQEDWFLSAPVGDLYIQAFSAISGAYYVDKETCVYRKASVGSWTSVTLNAAREREFLNRQVSAILALSSHFEKDRNELSNQMLAQAYFFSALRTLKIREFSLYTDLMDQAQNYMVEESRGYRLYYGIRRYPKLAYLVAKTLA